MWVNLRRGFGLGLLSLTVCLGTACAQDDAAPDPAPVTAKSSDPFAVPKDAKPADLVAFIKRLVQRDVEGETEEERETYFKKVAVSLLEATKLALAADEIDEEDAEIALAYRFQALDLQRQLSMKGIEKLELELAEKYSKDKRKALSSMAKKVLISARLRMAKDLSPEDQDLLLEDTIANIQPDGKPTNQSVRSAMEIGRILEDSGNAALAAKCYEKFADSFTLTKQAELVALGKKFKGTARRLRLPGNPLEVEGTLINGKPFDYSKYQGKVILVDFWATWCGPCIEEIPNIKQNYADYHSKGFEVIGISLDDELPAVESFVKKNKIPWSTLFSHDPDAVGVEHPLAVKYGVMQIPCMMLVGKDGKVISTKLRGPQLAKLLKEHLGEPEKSTESEK